uniref:Odorant-binding protein 1 n=2 Tax=Neoptera TaxID=33340 RepID=A0A6B9RZ64_9HEMI|nr:odorant binding protein 13 [Xylotrechus quadripes]QHI06947.1 odorant-binding protein 1 [Helopeltis theivora]
MKSFLLVAFIVGAVTAGTLPASEQQFVNQVHAHCQSNPKTFVDENLLKNLSANKDNAQVGVHMLCMSKGAGLQGQNGEINKGAVQSKVALVIRDSSKVNEIVNKCAVKTGSWESTAVSMWLCLNKNQVPYTPILN